MIGPSGPGGVPPVSEDLDGVLLAGDSLAAVLVDVDLLLAADSPRLEGESLAHARMLAGLGAALPPIVVHRDTMRVIDGMHRLRAAVLRGDAEIEVRFFDGSAAAAFVAGVEANIAHGLPLSAADRRAAARRILGSYPQWSDRATRRAPGWTPRRSARSGVQLRICRNWTPGWAGTAGSGRWMRPRGGGGPPI